MNHLQIITTIVLLFSAIANANSMDRAMQMTRNQYYRVCVWRKSKVATLTGRTAKLRKRIAEIKDIIRTKSNSIYNSAMFTCCEYQVSYYGLSPETREIIEQIIGLNF
jgi:hypothetical protein